MLNEHSSGYFFHLFCSVPSKHRWSLTSSRDTCQTNIYQYTFFTSVAQFEANVAAHSPYPSSQAQGTFILILLFTSFAHFEANIATLSPHPRLHAKRTFIRILVFSSFAHFEANIATLSPQPSSHAK